MRKLWMYDSGKVSTWRHLCRCFWYSVIFLTATTVASANPSEFLLISEKADAGRFVTLAKSYPTAVADREKVTADLHTWLGRRTSRGMWFSMLALIRIRSEKADFYPLLEAMQRDNRRDVISQGIAALRSIHSGRTRSEIEDQLTAHPEDRWWFIAWCEGTSGEESADAVWARRVWSKFDVADVALRMNPDTDPVVRECIRRYGITAELTPADRYWIRGETSDDPGWPLHRRAIPKLPRFTAEGFSHRDLLTAPPARRALLWHRLTPEEWQGHQQKFLLYLRSEENLQVRWAARCSFQNAGFPVPVVFPD